MNLGRKWERKKNHGLRKRWRMILASISFVLFFSVSFLSSCISAKEMVEEESVQNGTPVFPEVDIERPFFPGELNQELDYDQIEVVMWQNGVFQTTDERIGCSIINHHAGYGFYFYEVAFIEKKIQEQWVYLPYKEGKPTYCLEEYCCCAGDPGKPQAEYAAPAACLVRDLVCEQLTPGEYRLVVGVGNKTCYLNFTVKEVTK